VVVGRELMEDRRAIRVRPFETVMVLATVPTFSSEVHEYDCITTLQYAEVGIHVFAFEQQAVISSRNHRRFRNHATVRYPPSRVKCTSTIASPHCSMPRWVKDVKRNPSDQAVIIRHMAFSQRRDRHNHLLRTCQS
jgi:hypothetical protein